MIKDYIENLSKKNLYPFHRRSGFIYHVHEENWEFIVYFQYKTYNRIDEEKYETIDLPSNMFEISSVLLRLWVIKNELRYSDEYKQEEPWLLALDTDYFEKLNLLEEILYNQDKRENPLLLDSLTKTIEDKYLRIQTIITELNIKDDIVIFDDIQIFIHAISIKYPEKLEKISKLTEKQYWNQNNINFKKGNNSTHYIEIQKDIFYYTKQKLFKNPLNKKEYNIKWHWSYDIMMNLLLKQQWTYIHYDDFHELKVMKKKWDSREDSKKITDTKDNLHKNLKRKLEINKKVSFIEVNNWLKITLK
jgi:hypothetical protein